MLDGTLTFSDAACATGSGVSMPVEATIVTGRLTDRQRHAERSAAFSVAAMR